MAGFAIHLRNFIKKPKVGLGMDMHGHLSKNGYLEPDLLSHFASHRSSVECRGSNTEVCEVACSESLGHDESIASCASRMPVISCKKRFFGFHTLLFTGTKTFISTLV